LRDRFEATHMAAIDTETTGLDIVRDEIMFWSLSFGDDRWFLDRKYLWEFEKVWADKRRTWIGTNTKYDAHMMANAGCDLAGDFIDTLVMDRLLNPDNDHGLKEVYEREFDEKMATFGETFYPLGPSGKPYRPKGQSLEQIMWKAWDERPEKVVDYASLDAWGSYRVYKRLRKYLRTLVTWRGISLWDIFCDFELPFTRVLYDMERRGMQIDTAYLESLIPKIEKEQGKVKKQLAKAAGQIVNPNSPKQLIDLFIYKLGLPVLGKTKGGDPQMSEAVLSKYVKMGAKEAEHVLRFRKLGKILGTYVLGLLNAADMYGRVHGTFKQHRADTSRLSSADPNLQNIPRPDSDEFKLRQAFIARAGCKYVAADYDQIEMYLAAHFSGDKGMIDAIFAGRDLHSSNAALIWNESYDDIVAAKKKHDGLTERDMQLREYRQFVKVIGFGLLYGKGPNRLADELKFMEKLKKENPKWSEKKVKAEAKKMAVATTEKFFSGIPGVRAWINDTHLRAAETKYVESLSGRRRWLQQIMDWDERVAHQKEAEAEALLRHRDPASAMCWCDDCRESRAGDRRAVNTIIQGSAADVIQKAMIKNHEDPYLSEVDTILQVHDENGFEVPEVILKDAMDRIKHNMEHPGYDDLTVPLKCDPESGPNWMVAK